MIKKYRIPLLILVVVLQTAALVGMVAIKHRTLVTGSPVLLETEPIDPRSLFRGDYVRLNYAISRLENAAVEGDENFERHDDIYVVLREGEKFWEPVSMHREMPAHGPDSVVIRGEVQWGGGTSSNRINVRYGIENYFVPADHLVRVFDVQGMCCNGCAGKLAGGLGELSEVTETAVDVQGGTVSVIVEAAYAVDGLLTRLNVDKYTASLRP